MVIIIDTIIVIIYVVLRICEPRSVDTVFGHSPRSREIMRASAVLSGGPSDHHLLQGEDIIVGTEAWMLD